MNCNENHTTLAMKCIKRKEIIKEKRSQVTEREKMSYANRSQTTLPPRMPTYKIPEITKEELLKINICIAHSQAKKQEKPGTYASELNKVLTANKLPNIIIPNDTDTETQQMSEQH